MKPVTVVVWVATVFVVVSLGIFAAAFFEYMSVQLAMLMLVALLGLYLGFGVLVAVWRFTSKLK
jgi:hypothetical protein